MTPNILSGLVFAAFALALYSAAVYFLKKRNLADKVVTYLFSAGYLADMAGMVIIMWSTGDSPLTLHEALAYSSLILMCAVIVIIWRYRLLDEKEPLPRYVWILSALSYGWWAAVFLVGLILRFAGINPVVG